MPWCCSHRLVPFPDFPEVTSSSFRVGVAPEDSDDSEEASGMPLCPDVGRMNTLLVNQISWQKEILQGPSHKGILQCGCQLSMM